MPSVLRGLTTTPFWSWLSCMAERIQQWLTAPLVVLTPWPDLHDPGLVLRWSALLALPHLANAALRWGLVILVVLITGQALLRLLLSLFPALELQIARSRELASRLWRLLLDLVRELLWIDPVHRRRRHARWSRGEEEETSFGITLLRVGLDLLCLPLDWFLSLGLVQLLRPDPATEDKQLRRTPRHDGLLARLGWACSRHLNVYLLLSVLRLIWPRPRLPGVLWKRMVHPDSFVEEWENPERPAHGGSFPIRGMVWLCHNADVRELLARPESFEVVYGPRMRRVTAPLELPGDADGSDDPSERGNFLLGMQDTPRYWRDISNMRLAFRREDSETCRQLAEAAAERALEPILRQQHRRDRGPDLVSLDLPRQLVLPALEALVIQYFGIPLPLRCADASAPGGVRIDHDHSWLALIFKYLFYDLIGEDSREACLEAAPRLRLALEQIIRDASQSLQQPGEEHTAHAPGQHGYPEPDDVLSRCLRLQRSGTPGMDDETLRVNLTGFLVGAMTPLINATCQVMEVLLQRPRAMAEARTAARRHDTAALQACVAEALRFLPGDPVIYRWTNGDTWIGAGSRRCHLAKGTLVMAWNSSAMFDPACIRAPWDFRSNRPRDAYLHWGHGQHSCAGAYINMAVIPAILAPLLRQGPIQRAPGADGQPCRGSSDGITISRFQLLIRPAAVP